MHRGISPLTIEVVQHLSVQCRLSGNRHESVHADLARNGVKHFLNADEKVRAQQDDRKGKS